VEFEVGEREFLFREYLRFFHRDKSLEVGLTPHPHPVRLKVKFAL
jgi:hypothetical protein